MPDLEEKPREKREDKMYEAALDRYTEKKGEDDMNPFKEQELWEEHQIKSAQARFGSKDGATPLMKFQKKLL